MANEAEDRACSVCDLVAWVYCSYCQLWVCRDCPCLCETEDVEEPPPAGGGAR